MSSKTIFKNTIKLANTERPVFVPFVYGLAARVSQLPLQDIVSDASYYASSLEDACRLFKYDGIVNNYDSSLEAEAFGCKLEWNSEYMAPVITGCPQPEIREAFPEASSRIQVVLEATRRIVMNQGRETAVIGVLTGPCSLVKTLIASGASAKNIIPMVGNLLTKLSKSLCELRVDAVFFREDLIGGGFRDELRLNEKAYAAVYATIFNLIRYYDCSPELIIKDIEIDFITELQNKLGPGGVILQAKRLSGDDLPALQKLSESLKMPFGLPLPLGNQAVSEEEYRIISGYMARNRPRGFFYVSEGEVPHNMPLENLHELITRMR